MKRLSIVFILSLLSLGLLANSPLNFGLNFRVNMPRATYESTNWDGVLDEVHNGNYTNSLEDVDKSQFGYAGGAFLRFNKGKGFLHTEAMFSFNSTGISTKDGDSNQTLTLTQESTDFNMPVYIGRNLINSSIFKVRAFTGPTLRWTMNSEYSAEHSGNDLDMDTFNSNVDLDNFSWLWSVGAGVEVFMFSLDARYGFDVKGISGATQLENSFSQKTNMLEFTLGFKLF